MDLKRDYAFQSTCLSSLETSKNPCLVSALRCAEDD